MSPSEARAITSPYRLSAPEPQASPSIPAALRKLAPVLSDQRARVAGDGPAGARDHRPDDRRLRAEPRLPRRPRLGGAPPARLHDGAGRHLRAGAADGTRRPVRTVQAPQPAVCQAAGAAARVLQ